MAMLPERRLKRHEILCFAQDDRARDSATRTVIRCPIAAGIGKAYARHVGQISPDAV
jgi:hypothetical protein